jgi:phospholipid-translocating ATPase
MQVFIIHNSLDLYDPHSDKRTECRAMNITEELGQIQYVFSDKTGTLTENRMIFRRCTINGVEYNHPPSEEEKISLPHAPIPPVVPNTNLQIDFSQTDSNGRMSQHAQRCKEFMSVLALCNTVVVSELPHRDNMNASGVVEFHEEHGVTLVKPSDPLINDHYLRLSESRSITPSPTLPTSLPIKPHVPSLSPIPSSSAESSPESDSPPMRIKAVTPTERMRSIVSKLPMVPQILSTGKHIKKFHINSKQKFLNVSKSNISKSSKPIYEAESPDELALVNSAYAYGFILENRNPNTVLITEAGEGAVEYDILKVLPFDSNRKCMSIVVRKIGGHEVVLYTKGADSTIMPALAPIAMDTEEYRLREKTENQLELYARQGLRVLVVAKRILNPIEFSEWYSQHQECEMSTDNREKKVMESFGLLERNLTLLGATGIEDRLQENVPETIASLLQAGIVIWVLTGDKTETAINVAYSAKLFNSQMEILRITARSRDSAENCINFYLGEIEKQLVESDGENIRNRALVIDGKTLTFILDPKSNLTIPFLELTRYCSSVLCCRSTPLQKAFLVKVVKEELKMSTLAIGDGANDVSMIQMADVGVGICGQEGMQAVMASDFAIAKFKILEKLLLIHGHLNYDRLAKLIIYFFYKNAVSFVASFRLLY